MRKRTLNLLSLCLAVLMLCLCVFPAAAAESKNSAEAATMQLMKTTGTVNVTNSNRRSLTKRDNMRLYNGYHIETMAASYAWINLDSTKLTKLDAVSEAEVRKSGKVLELLVKSGSLYFNITSPLEDDETLNIRTATMVVGIRGTCGWIRMVDRWSTEVYVLEGTVQCSVTDPVTGQVKTAELQSGDKAVAAVYSDGQNGDKCGIVRDRIEASDIGGFILEELAQDPGLCGDIYEASGLDALPPMGFLESVRRQLDDIREEMDSIREQLAGGELSAEDAQARLDGSRQQMEDVRGQLEQAGAGSDIQQQLDEAQGHLDQARDALAQDGTVHQDVLDSLGSAQGALDSAQQQQASDAQQKSAESAQGRLEQDQQDMQGQLTGQDAAGSTSTVWDQGSSGSTPGASDSNSNTNTGTGGGTTSPPPTTPPEQPPAQVMTMPKTAQEVQNSLNANGTVTLRPSASASENVLTVNIPMTIAAGQTLILSDGIGVNIGTGSSLTIDGTMTGEGTNTLTNNGALTVNSSNTLKVTSIINNGVILNETAGRIVTNNLVTTETGHLGSRGIIEGTVTNNGGDTQITGGTITATGTGGAALVVQGGGTISIYGGTIDGGSLPAILVDSSSTAVITIGDPSDGSNRAVIKSHTPTIIQSNGGSVNLRYVVGVGSYVDGSAVTPTPDSDGSYHLTGPSTGMVESLNAARDGDTVTLSGNIQTAAALSINAGSKSSPVVLNLNGYTLTLTGTGVHTVSGALRILDGSGAGSGKLELSQPIEVSAGAAFAMSGGEVNSSCSYTVGCGTGASLELSGGTITNSGTGYALCFTDSVPDVILGSTVIRSKGSELFGTGSYPYQPWMPDGCASVLNPADNSYYLTKQ